MSEMQVCARGGCSREFAPRHGGGRRQIYCRIWCQKMAAIERKARKKAAGHWRGGMDAALEVVESYEGAVDAALLAEELRRVENPHVD